MSLRVLLCPVDDVCQQQDIYDFLVGARRGGFPRRGINLCGTKVQVLYLLHMVLNATLSSPSSVLSQHCRT